MKSHRDSSRRIKLIRAPADVLEVLDRVLDRGIVIDAWLRVSVVGLALVDVDARVVVASIRTYVQEGPTVAGQGLVSHPTAAPRPETARARRPAITGRKRKPLAAAPRAQRRAEAPAKVMLRCAEGCTFLRAKKSPVRCPSDRSRTCAVSPV